MHAERSRCWRADPCGVHRTLTVYDSILASVSPRYALHIRRWGEVALCVRSSMTSDSYGAGNGPHSGDRSAIH